MSRTGRFIPENIRDCALMAKRGESFDYIRDVLGWSDEGLKTVCKQHNIVIRDAPSRPPAREMRPPPAERRPGAGRPHKPAEKLRSVNLLFQTTPALEAAVFRASKKFNRARSRILHDLLAAIERRDLWADLLDSDSDSQSVASVSPQETSQRK